MTTFIVIIIVIVVIAVLAGNSKKKTQLTATTNPTSGNSSNADRQQVFTGEYLPQNIQRTGLQVLETIHIIGTSKAVDTIKGRYDFLLQIIGTAILVTYPTFKSQLTHTSQCIMTEFRRTSNLHCF